MDCNTTDTVDLIKGIKAMLFSTFILLLCFSLTSCNHYYYAPNEGANLVLQEKNDAKISFGTGGSGANSNGDNYSLIAGYSPINHLGIQSSYFKLNVDDTNSGAAGNGEIWSLAIGGYYFIDREDIAIEDEYRHDQLSMRRAIIFDLYGGLERGNVTNHYDARSESFFTFEKRFIQLGGHFQGQRYGADIAFKGGRLDYKTARITGPVDDPNLREIESVLENDSYAFLETSMRIHFGFRQGRLFVNWTRLRSPRPTNVRFINGMTQVGFILEIDELFREKHTKWTKK